MRAVADSVGRGDDVGMGEHSDCLQMLQLDLWVTYTGTVSCCRSPCVQVFRQAVREAVSPVDVVVDIGPGQGSWHCWQSGLALESTP